MMEITMLKKVDLSGATFVEGFPGIGLVGPMSISYMIDKLDMECVGYIDSQNFPPLISIHKGEPMHPIRLYYSKQNQIITIFAEFAIPLDLVYEITETVYGFVTKNKIKVIYSIGGLPIGMQPGQQAKGGTVFGVASKKSLSTKMQKAELKPIVEGVSTGVSAMLLVKSKADELDNINLMVAVQPGIVDPRYAESAIICLNKLMELDIDISDLEREAKEVEAKISEIISKHKESHENYKNAVGDSGPSMYA
ncbi:MAG: proteasome assembly chaperone family protein [Candidatus Micrarchaeota archaeon]|nr:proteasome assembly chaperone family protein [Candidatus Micrarchaeota archaeon]